MQVIEIRSDDSQLNEPPSAFTPHSSCAKIGELRLVAAEVFQSHRARLFAIAHRMLRNRGDAEDVVQDAYLRWHEISQNEIDSPLAFLITVTTRLCLDRLRQWKKERNESENPALTDSIVEDHACSPEEQWEIAGDVTAALVTVFERLGREERAVFLLREVFDYDYPEVAQMVGKTEPACRQLIHRSRARLRDAHAEFPVTAECRDRLLRKFIAASNTGDRDAVTALLAEEIDYVRAA